MTEPLLTIPDGGWTVDDLDALRESHDRRLWSTFTASETVIATS